MAARRVRTRAFRVLAGGFFTLGLGLGTWFTGGSALAQEVPGNQASTRTVRIERAEGPQLSAATGHFARARLYIQSALKEFDAGRKLADPSSLLDVEQLRSNLIFGAEALGRVLDPQPRASESGVRFDPDPRLMGQSGK